MPLDKNLPFGSLMENRVQGKRAAGFSTVLALLVLILTFQNRAFGQCDPNAPECDATLNPDFCKITQSLTLVPGIYSEGLNICASGITVDGNGATLRTGSISLQGLSGVTIKNFILEHGIIYISSCSYVTVENCFFNMGPGGFGSYVSVTNSNNITILNNQSNLTSATPYVATLGSSSFCRIENNEFTTFYGILLDRSRQNLIQNNILIHPDTTQGGQGIQIGNTPPPVQEDGNQIIRNSILGYSGGIAITGNSGTNGAHRTVVDSNEIRGPGTLGGTGIFLVSDSNLISRNRIHNFRGSGSGIQIYSIFGNPPQGNTVVFNTIQNNATGIYENTLSLDGNKIYFNNFIDNTNQGTAVDFANYWDADSVCGGNYWNDFDDTTEGCLDANADGICDTIKTKNGGPPVDRFPFRMANGWVGRQLPPGEDCLPPARGQLRLVPIHSVFLFPNGSSYPLVAQKNLVIRAFFDTGPLGPTTGAIAELCIDGEVDNCPPGQLFETPPVMVYPSLHNFTEDERKQGLNSLNLFIRDIDAFLKLTAGTHTFHVRVRPVFGDPFLPAEDSITGEFKLSRKLLNLIIPVAVKDTTPDIEGAADRALLEGASNFMRAVYPVDEERVRNNLQTQLRFASLPNTNDSQRDLIVTLERRRVAILGQLPANETEGIYRNFAAGVLNNIVADANPFGEGILGFTYPDIPAVVATLDRHFASGLPVIGSTIAHEAGHLFDLGDEYTPGTVKPVNPPHGAVADGFGNARGWFVLEQDLAYDVGAVRPGGFMRPVFGSAASPPAIYGFMGNQNDQNSWTRSIEYRHLYDSLTPAPSLLFARENSPPSVPREVVGITGLITKTDSVAFDPLIIANTDLALDPNPAGTQYRLEFRSAGGAVLDSFSFDLRFTIEYLGDSSYYDSTENTPFSFMAELPNQTASIVLLKSQTVLGSIVRSATPPTVNILSARPKSGGIEVRWQGGDADGDSLSYIVMYSPDSAQGLVAGVDVKDTVFQITLDGSTLPPQAAKVLATQSSVTVYASDGFNYATDTVPVAGLLGDLNLSGDLTPADVVLELNCVFLGTGNCSFATADVNCDRTLSPADVVLLLNTVFLGSPFPCQ